jgi:hypothetical protein
MNRCQDCGAKISKDRRILRCRSCSSIASAIRCGYHVGKTYCACGRQTTDWRSKQCRPCFVASMRGKPRGPATHTLRPLAPHLKHWITWAAPANLWVMIRSEIGA